MATRGRKSTYTDEIADQICARLATGESLAGICRDEGMPPESTVRTWVIDDPSGFAAKYARARDIGLDCVADEIIRIADTPIEGVVVKESEDGVETTRKDMLEHRRLQVEARKWYLSKLAPKRYGDRQQVDVGGQQDNPITVKWID